MDVELPVLKVGATHSAVELRNPLLAVHVPHPVSSRK
jgi:hypothetical protein